MLPSTWNTLLDELRAYGARRQQRRAQGSAQQAAKTSDYETRTGTEIAAASEVQNNTLEQPPGDDSV